MTQPDVTEFLDADPLDGMSPEQMLSLLVGDKAEKSRSKAEVTAVTARALKMTNATKLNTSLPPDDRLSEYWTLVLGVGSAEADPLISNWYSNCTFEDADGNFYKCTIASGVTWLHQSIFDGVFRDAALQHAVDVGYLELHAPGTQPNPRTFTKEFREGWSSGALKLVTDSRTLRYVAKILGDRTPYKDALLLKANQLAAEGK